MTYSPRTASSIPAVSTWRDLEFDWPAEPIALYGTGEDSGTHQFFTQNVVGEEGVSRDDYTVTEGHPITAEGVIADDSALGFLPFPRYLEVQEEVRLAAVDSGEGYVAPSADTIQDGSYAALSRALYIYLNNQSLERPEVVAFLQFYFADVGGFAESAGLVATQESVYEANAAGLAAAVDDIATPVGASTLES
jgi:phosphate transport system substrate-binding protein